MSPCMTIYTQPGCQRCAATKRVATKVGITPIMVDVSADQDAADALRARGELELPVVSVTDAAGAEVRRWSGFRPELVKDAAGAMA